MIKSGITFLFSIWFVAFAQTKPDYFKDSIEISVNTLYNTVSSSHRKFFGENYRKEWAAKTKLPVIKISDFKGGLTPTEPGGGHQSRSLRLKDSLGNEWVLRTVNKFTDELAPAAFKGSAYEDWMEDNFSAQHPFSALAVPVLAQAVGVPHTQPVIGWVAPDNKLGSYEREFAGTVCLLEQREPLGLSSSTSHVLLKLAANNTLRVDSSTFFKARLLDLLIGDWGRHADQWRWVLQDSASTYVSVPRDRDQVFYVNEGILPKRASGVSALAFLEGFNKTYKNVNSALLNGSTLNQQFLNQFSYAEWMALTTEFVAALPDSVLEKAINQLPASAKQLRKNELLSKLKSRRDNLPAAMGTYYHFLYHIVDVRASDKDEWIEFSDDASGKLLLDIYKLNPYGQKENIIFHNTFDPHITKEIRLFTGKGNDRVNFNTKTTTIKLRVVGGNGKKIYHVVQAENKIHVYENRDGDIFNDTNKDLRKHISNDSLNTAQGFTNLYRNSGFSPAFGLRSGDGLLLGLSYKIENEGFRKLPYGSMHKFTVLHSLTNKTLRFKYAAEWLKISPKTDFLINAFADLPSNRINFFGVGNETAFDDTGDFRTYYRTAFNFFTVEPAFRIKSGNHLRLSVGPSFQYSKLKSKDNENRFIKLPEIAETYIGQNLTKEKSHGGMFIDFNYDSRNNNTFPSKGVHFDLRLQGYEGLNKFSDDFAQAFPQLSLFKSLDKKGHIVLANRVGGAYTKGKTTFYQSAFLGGQDNLLGYLKFRFAGDHAVYNNFEARINLPNFLRYALPGRIGLIGFYDVGRVWIDGEKSNKLHQATGGGIYIAPFNRFIARGILGYSEEGLFPNIFIGQRF